MSEPWTLAGRLRALCRAATEGPLYVLRNNADGRCSVVNIKGAVVCVASRPDAKWISEGLNALPAALDAVERLTRERDEARATIQSHAAAEAMWRERWDVLARAVCTYIGSWEGRGLDVTVAAHDAEIRAAGRREGAEAVEKAILAYRDSDRRLDDSAWNALTAAAEIAAEQKKP